MARSPLSPTPPRNSCFSARSRRCSRSYPFPLALPWRCVSIFPRSPSPHGRPESSKSHRSHLAAWHTDKNAKKRANPRMRGSRHPPRPRPERSTNDHGRGDAHARSRHVREGWAERPSAGRERIALFASGNEIVIILVHCPQDPERTKTNKRHQVGEGDGVCSAENPSVKTG